MGSVEMFTSVVTAVIAVAGFIAVVLQLHNLQEQVRGAASGSIYDMAANLKQVFVADPHLRKYFYSGEAIDPDHPEHDKVEAIADFFCLYLEQIVTQSASIATENRESWFSYAAGIYDRSPIVRRYLRSEGRADWYSERFWSTIEAHSRLTIGEPDAVESSGD